MNCTHPEDEDEDSFFEEGEGDENNTNQQVVPPKSLAGPSNLSINNSTDASHLSHTREVHAGSNSLSQVNVLSNPGLLPSALTKSAQMQSTTLTTNLATAYNLSRDHTRDLGRSDGPSHLGELHHGAALNTAPTLNHSAAGLSVTRTVVDNNLAKPSDAALSYKSEDPLGYGYDTQARMNDAAARGTEYNYTPYGFPGSYYGYHFLGQY